MIKRDQKISLVIPSYNEEENIETVISKCLSILSGFCDEPEIIVVNDGSTDRTAEIADRLSLESNGLVKVIHNPINLNAGISLLIGLNAATGAFIVHSAADYPFDLMELGSIIPLLENHDIVVVTRRDKNAHSFWRKVTSLTHKWIIRILFRPGISDMNFLQVYRSEVIKNIKVGAKSPSFVTPELLIRSKDAGYKITEYDADFLHREKGKTVFGKPRDILWSLSDIVSFWIERFSKR